MQKLPIVILHGWNLSNNKYLSLINLLKKRGFAVYAPDLPGFGKSEIPDRVLNLSDYVDFVEMYFQKHTIKKAIIIGHSFGGRVAIKMAGVKPKKVAGLILTGVPGLVPVSRAKLVFFLFLSKIGKKLFQLPLINIFETRARNFLYRIAKASDYQRTEGVMRETFKNIIREDLTFPMKQISTPTLLVWGEDDKTVSIVIAQKMMSVIKSSKLAIIPIARHGLPWTHPDLFFKKIEKFLQNL